VAVAHVVAVAVAADELDSDGKAMKAVEVGIEW